MTRTSSETRSERGGGGGGACADILDLDRYMRTTRPPRPRTAQAHKDSDLLVVDNGGVGGSSSRSASDSDSDVVSDVASSVSVSRQNKRFSHDSGLSDTSYRNKRQQRRNKTNTPSGGRSVARSGAAASKRRGAAAAAGERRGAAVKRRGSESSAAHRAVLERALRDQQAQLARVQQLCELQAQAQTQARTQERTSGRRSSDAKRPASAHRRADTSTRSDSSALSSSSSGTPDSRKHPSGDCRTYKIIMSKLDELNRLFAARRAAAPPPPPRAARAPPRRASSGSVTVSDKVVGTETPRPKTQQPVAAEGAGRGGSCVVAYALTVDIPPRPNVITQSVVHSDEGADETAPGGFHLDDPVRLYQQAKRLEAARPRRVSSSGSSPRGSSHGSCRGSCKGSCKGACKGSCTGSRTSVPSLCTLCRCYWSILRRYVAAQLGGAGVRE